MSHFITNLKDLVIANTGSDSGHTGPCDDADAITVYAPAALTGTINLQGSPDPIDAAPTNWFDLKSSGSNITVAANGAVTVTDVGFHWLRVHSTGAEAAERTFQVRKQYATG